VSNILTLTQDAIQPTPEVASEIARTFVKGVVAAGDEMISVLTIQNLLPEPVLDAA
jgi:purine-binding chemotaxis protein CheW